MAAEHAMMTFISILVTIAIGLLAILIVSLRNWKIEITGKIDKVCDDNEKDHNEIWDRVNHHWHNGGGNVVIPTAGIQKGG